MAYVEIAEYLATYGERETTLLTNETTAQGAGRVTYDDVKLDTALDDATDEVEGYISRRYRVPLENPPTIVKGWVKAIARLKLAEATGRVNDGIKDAANRATRQLERLVDNKLNLPVPSNDEPLAPVGTGSVLTSGDRPAPTFGDALDRYTAPFTGSYGEPPRWTQGG